MMAVSQDSLNNSLPSSFSIPIVHASQLDYTRAYEQFFKPNLPFIVTGLTDDWPARKDWIHVQQRQIETKCGENSNMVSKLSNAIKVPAWKYLKEHYGHFQVSVLQCAIPFSSSPASTPIIKESEETADTTFEGNDCPDYQGNARQGYEEGDIVEMSFAEVIDLWESGNGKGLYIRDWHLGRELRNERRDKHQNSENRKKTLAANLERSSSSNDLTRSSEMVGTATQRAEESHYSVNSGETSSEDSFYTTPDILKDDWMDNYYSNEMKDDFAFVYFGTKGTFTPLHRDVYTSYSWSANILGRKKWHFVPPSSIQHCRLYPSSPTSALHPDIRPGAINPLTHPNILKAHIIESIQPEESIIFVPSNWYHCVENLDEFVISINQNWCNSNNLESIFQSMKKAVKETEEALGDIRRVLERRKKQMETGKPLISCADRKNSEKERMVGDAGLEVSKEENEEEGPHDELDIEREWDQIVQNVLEQNTGWGWKTFYSMIDYNLSHPPAPPHLSPPSEQLTMVLRNVFQLDESTLKETETQEITTAPSTLHALEKKVGKIMTPGNMLEASMIPTPNSDWSAAYEEARTRAVEYVTRHTVVAVA